MPLDSVLTTTLAGLTVGGLARLVWNAGGYGLIVDLLLGLAGGAVGTSILLALVSFQESGRVTSASIAFLGGTSMIVAQRVWCRGG